MAEEKRRTLGKHNVLMENREHVSLTGVVDVLSFDEEGIIADTEQGMIVIKGSNLHVGKLNLEDGQLSVDGFVESIDYTDGQLGKGKGSFLGRIFK